MPNKVHPTSPPPFPQPVDGRRHPLRGLGRGTAHPTHGETNTPGTIATPAAAVVVVAAAAAATVVAVVVAPATTTSVAVGARGGRQRAVQ